MTDLAELARAILLAPYTPPVRYVPCPVCSGRGCHSRRVGAIWRHDDCANCAGNGSIVEEQS